MDRNATADLDVVTSKRRHDMKRIQFKCTLLSDVIINQKSATEGGSNNTLDFIPGNVFLGIVASRYKEFGDKALEVFHSGNVRFGDAHPVSNSQDEIRTLHVPASLFHPKNKAETSECYIHHFYKRSSDHTNAGRPQQLKQCRQGFYAFSDNKGFPATLEKSFAIKSAYDREYRRALDNNMYGYESLNSGACFLFDIEIENEALVSPIRSILLGSHHIGRSRTAQYGTVEIQETEYEEMPSRQQSFQIDGHQGEYITVYADGRLIFLDKNDEPTFQPQASDLGIVDGEIDWKLSQIRTFHYAPWNNKRSTHDTERCGIEKGSVFVVHINQKQKYESKYVGEYKNEGFGKVIYNPAFLESAGNNGAAVYHLQEPTNDKITSAKCAHALGGTTLLNYIAKRRESHVADSFIYDVVNQFATQHSRKFADNTFASQWGAIRSIAMRKTTYKDIVYELFEKEEKRKTTKDNIETTTPNAYITHGIAASRWKKYGRGRILRNFIDNVHSLGQQQNLGDITAKALVNLSSEMAKHSKA